MTMQGCPQIEDLASFCGGMVDDEEYSAQIASHVEVCTRCQSSLETLVDQVDDPILAQLRQDRQSDNRETPCRFEAEAMCREVVALVAELSVVERRPLSNDADFEEPDILPSIAGYEFQQLLGQGGMGSVHQALHVGLEKVVAIKLLTRRLARNKAAVERFRREMKAVGKLQHPNIVSAHDAGEANGTPYLVMEYVPGADLGVLIRQHTVFAVPDACELIRQAACGLEHAARRGLVHRDIKPSNLILTQVDGGPPVVKILDFGLTLLAIPNSTNLEEEAQPGLTGSGQVMGTVEYMSPEQALDSHDVDARSDIYGLGATLFKLLTGVAPFMQGRRPNLARQLAALAYETAPPVTTRRPDLPPELARLVDSMLSRARENRPATAGEVAQRLAPFCEGCRLEDLLRQKSAAEVSSLTVIRQEASTASASDARTEVIPLPQPADASATTRPGTPCQTAPGVRLRRNLLRLLAVGVAGVALLAGWIGFQTFLVQTANGFVMVEILDPSVEATLGDKSFTVSTSGKKYEFTPGEHLLRVEHGGLQFETDNFLLRKGKTEVFRVRLVSGRVQMLRDGQEFGLRAVAEFAAKPGEKVKLPVVEAPSVPGAPGVPSPTGLGAYLASPDWEWTIPENLGPLVNSDEHECFPQLSKDGNRLWFMRGFNWRDMAYVCERESRDKPWKPATSLGQAFDFKGPMADFHMSRDEQTWIFATWVDQVPPWLMVSTRPSPQAAWSTPTRLHAAGHPAQFPALSDDGLTLYLMKNFLDDKGDEICTMTRPNLTADWSNPIPLGDGVNVRGGDERPTWVSADGLVLVFHSSRGSQVPARQFDLWFATRPSLTSPWEPAVSFGPVVNSPSYEGGACLSEDGRELIFECHRPGGRGTSDLYVSRRVPR